MLALDLALKVEDVDVALDDQDVRIGQGHDGFAVEQRPAALFQAAHDIKGQAPLFGYGLVGAVATALADMTRGRSAFEPARRASVQAHVEALESLVANDIKGGGGDLGRDLLAELEIRRQGL
jgi:HPt (histidine-containing phosphotransfer) domain-containing protein